MEVCYYCKERPAKYPPHKGTPHWCCKPSYQSCPVIKEKSSFPKRGQSSWNKGKEHTLETRKKISEALKGQNNFFYNKHFFGDKNGMWNGGNINWFHARARELFSKNKCELCNMSDKDHKKEFKMSLHMHCKSGNWEILEEQNWKCICIKCHRKIHKLKEQERKNDSRTYAYLQFPYGRNIGW